MVRWRDISISAGLFTLKPPSTGLSKVSIPRKRGVRVRARMTTFDHPEEARVELGAKWRIS